jgi:hypothetical protein
VCSRLANSWRWARSAVDSAPTASSCRVRGPVAQHDHPAQFRRAGTDDGGAARAVAAPSGGAAGLHLAGGGDQHAGADQLLDRGGLRVRRGQQGGEEIRQAGRVQRPADELGVDRYAQQPLGFAVEDRDPPVLRDADDALVHAAQHRLLVLHERRNLLRLEAEGEAFEAPAQQQRGHRAEGQGARRRGCNGQHVAGQAFQHRPAGEADADLADHISGIRREDRHLGARRMAERALFLGGDLAAGQRLGGIGAHALAQQGGIGMRQPQAGVVRDHHEQRPGAAPDVLGQRLQRAASEGRGGKLRGRGIFQGCGGGPDVARGGHGPCHGQGLALCLVAQPLVGQPAQHDG